MITTDREGSPEYLVKLLNLIIGVTENKRCLDLMCCEGNVSRNLDFRIHDAVDINPKWRKTWDDNPKSSRKFYIDDALNREVYAYDVILCLDGIEHLAKEQGKKLISKIDEPEKTIIIFTPDHAEKANYDEKSIDPDFHKCQWSPEDFDKTWKVIYFKNWHHTVGFGAYLIWKGGATEKELEAVL